MYDRAPRTFQGVQRSTSEHVGPGTYDHQRKKQAEESYAPFLSLSNRAEVFQGDENPGPGSYDLRSNPFPSTKAGGCTLASRTNRFNEKISNETPGPGAYEVARTSSLRSSIQEFSPRTGAGKQSRQSRFLFHRQSLPPSIPDPRSANGFEEDENGKLVAQVAASQDRTLGPAFYQSNATPEKDPNRLYHGVHFSKYSSKRTDFSGKAGPGPGDYDLNHSFQLEVQHMNLKSYDRRPELHVARYPESMLKIVAKDSVPGPGQYSIRRELDPDKSKGDVTGIETHRAPFGSHTKRFEVNLSDVPGPGAYDEKVSNAFSSLQSRTTSLRRNPFNQTSARFDKSEFKSRYAPGPGQYRIPAFTDESFRRALIEHGRKPPFNVAAVRRYTLVRKDQPDMPGPASYDINPEPFKPKLEQPTSNFLSNTSRELVVEDIPGPTAYDVSHAYEALITQRRKPPRTKDAALRQSQFLSASTRHFAGEVNSDTPGPGAYEGFLSARPHGFASLREQRFLPNKSQTPGPADYELSPLFEDTVLRGTFNATLNNPILNKLQDRALREEEEMNAADTGNVQTVTVH